jgi:hypothetical protein
VPRPSTAGISAIRVIVVLAVCLAAHSSADAFNFFDLEVDPYHTEGYGVAEFEWIQGFVPKGHDATEDMGLATDRLSRTSLELTYGVADHVDAGAQLDLAHANGESFEFAGSQFRLHGNFFEKGELPLDLSWAAELEWLRSPRFSEHALELDLHPIIERDFGRFTLTANPIFEKALTGGGTGIEFQYAAGVVYRWLPLISPAIEFYGDIGKLTRPATLSQQQHYIVPVILMRLPRRLRLNFGPGFGLTRRSDPVIAKFEVEFEWPTWTWPTN